MKLTTFILLISLMQVSAATFGQRITLKQNSVNIEKVFREIRKQTGYDILMGYGDFKAFKINVNFNNTSLTEVMDFVVKNTGLTYSIEEKNIVIKKKNANSVDRPAAISQTTDVKGTIVDGQGFALIGATIQIKGTKRMVKSAEKGQFFISNVDNDAILVISYIGFIPLEVPLKGAVMPLEIKLNMATGKLEEVGVTVNTGYQKIRPEQSTGAVAQITTRRYESQINTNFLDGLQGKLPGLLINNDIQFQGNNLFQIRGISTISGSSQPLIVMDGYLTNLSLSDINPNEIKSVNILKDAAAAAIYGVRASNGVVIVERKDAQPGPPKVTFRTTFGFTPKENYSRYRWAPSSASLDYVRFRYKDGDPSVVNPIYWDQFYKNASLAPWEQTIYKKAAGLLTQDQYNELFIKMSGYNNAEDYSRLFMRTAVNQVYNMNVSGGTDRLTYYLTANYTGNKASRIKNDNHQLQLSGRASMKFSNRFSLQLTTDYNESTNNTAPVPDINNLSPALHLQDDTGIPLPLPSDMWNREYASSFGMLDPGVYPLTDLNEITTKLHRTDNRITANFRYDIGEGFNLGFGGVYEISRADTRNLNSDKSSLVNGFVNYYTTRATDGSLVFNAPKGAYLQLKNADMSSYLGRVQLDYNKSIGIDHSFSAIAGAEINKTINQSNSQAYLGYNDRTLQQKPMDFARLTNGAFPSLYGANVGAPLNYSNLFNLTYTDDRYISAYANGAYSFRNTYSLTASIRMDQSNLFGTDEKYRYKPLWSIGAAWNIHKEAFMKNVDWVHALKLRIAKGFDGNVAKNSIPEVIAMAGTNAVLGATTFQNQLTLSSPANGGLRWEQTSNFNVGLDWAIFKGLSGSIDYYIKKSTDLLGATPVDPTLGVTSALINQASVNNRGLEFKLDADWITRKNFNWYTGFVLSQNRNKVLNVYATLPTLGTSAASPSWFFTPLTTYITGYPIAPLFSVKYAGLNNQGQPQMYGQDGQLTTTPLVNDMVYSGPVLPVYSAGISNRVDIGKFYFYCMVNYYGGFMTRVPRPNAALVRPQEGAENFWKKPGDELTTDVLLVRDGISSSALNIYNNSDKYVVHGDYITLSAVTLSYDFGSPKVLRSTGLSSVQLLLQGQNLYTWGLNKYNFSQATTSYVKSYVTPTYTVGVYANF